MTLLDKTEAGVRPVRLLGVSVHNLTDPGGEPVHPALPLFEDERLAEEDETGHS